MNKMIIVGLVFCLVSLSCQATDEIAEDAVLYEDGEVIVTEEMEIYENAQDTDTFGTFANIQFQPESAVLLESEMIKIQEIAEMLSFFPEDDLLIVGHAVLANTHAERQKLSKDRANAVADYLVELGAKTHEQVSTQGVGAEEQIVPDDTPQNRARNRRVEIIIIE